MILLITSFSYLPDPFGIQFVTLPLLWLEELVEGFNIFAAEGVNLGCVCKRLDPLIELA